MPDFISRLMSNLKVINVFDNIYSKGVETKGFNHIRVALKKIGVALTGLINWVSS